MGVSLSGDLEMVSFVRFFRDGMEIHTSKLNGFRYVSMGDPTGNVGRAACFASVTVEVGGKRQQAVTEADFDGPVSMAIAPAGGTPQWFGLASAASVACAAESV